MNHRGDSLEQAATLNRQDQIDIGSLIEAIQNADEQVRSDATMALGQSGDKRAVEPLIELLKHHHDPNVRWSVIQALWRLGDQQALKPLLAALKDKDSYVRRAAAYALGQLGDQRAIQPLLAAFRDESPGVRISASLALGEIGAAAVTPLLAFLEQEGHHDEVEHALRAMNDPQAVEPLLAALKSENRRMRAYAAQFLMHFGSERVIEHLNQALADPDRDVRHYAQVALDVLRANQGAPAAQIISMAEQEIPDHVNGRAG